MVEAFKKEMWRAADGKEFTSQAEALHHEVEIRLHQILNDRAAYGEIEVSTAVEVIMKEWSTLVTIMDELK